MIYNRNQHRCNAKRINLHESQIHSRYKKPCKTPLSLEVKQTVTQSRLQVWLSSTQSPKNQSASTSWEVTPTANKGRSLHWSMQVIQVPGIPISTSLCCCLWYRFNPLDFPPALDGLPSSLLGEKSRSTLRLVAGELPVLPGEKSLSFLLLVSGEDSGGLVLGKPFMVRGVAL